MYFIMIKRYEISKYQLHLKALYDYNHILNSLPSFYAKLFSIFFMLVLVLVAQINEFQS